MHTDEDDTSNKKKSEKVALDNLKVCLEKQDFAKTPDKSDAEDPKPRIVLTFRSEKSSAKSSNMKIVSTEEKSEEVTPRRSSRTRGKWEWVCDNETSPKKSISRSVSENDESDGSYTTTKRVTRRSSKDTDVIPTTVARKEKSNETVTPSQRLSRRIKPTPKILANEELRIGLESQNNARLGIHVDKSPEEGIRTRRSARPSCNVPESTKRIVKEDSVETIEVEESSPDDEHSQSSVMKLKHLCELGLKAINEDEADPEQRNEDEDEEEEDVEIDGDDDDDDDDDDEEDHEGAEEDEIDDDTEVITKLLEADEDSDEVYSPESEHPRRSSKAPLRRSSRRKRYRPDYAEEYLINKRPRRKKTWSSSEEDTQTETKLNDESTPAAGDEGSEAACPADESTIVATCLCETPSNVYAAPKELIEPVFCQAIEMVDDVRVGCSHSAAKEEDGSYAALVRAGPRSPFILACKLHTLQIREHMCCPACGLFCSQGIFYQCSEGHLFHKDCGLPYNDAKLRPGCPHCGVYSYRWQPVNRECCQVKIEMKCSNKRIFLPEQREQCTPAYLSFSSPQLSQLDLEPVIPEDLLPSPPVDLKKLSDKSDQNPEDQESAFQKLYEAILKNDTVEELITKIVGVSKEYINKVIVSEEGGSCVHTAARRGNLRALYLLQYAGGNIDAYDNLLRTPLMTAVQALLDNSEKTPKDKSIKKDTDKEQEMERDSKEEKDVVEDTDVKPDLKEESDTHIPKDEDLMKVIRYLVAAGCDVNLPGPDGMTALHMAAQYGSAEICKVILSSASAETDPRDHGGWTPLVWAAENKHADVVRTLVSAGAEAWAGDDSGNAAVHWCALGGDAASLRTLLDAAPNALHALNQHTDTPLHVAARQGHYACVVILLARGARTDIENSAGELPVEVCSGQCQTAISLNMQMTLAVRDKFTRYRLLCSDISNGREERPIPCVNEVDDVGAPEDFTYVTKHVMPTHIPIDCTLPTMQGCSCAGDTCSSASCACAVLGVRAWWRRGRLAPDFPYHDPPMLFECNQTCACNAKQCTNNVVTRMCARGSVWARVQVFRTRARGWGLRAAAAVPRGAPVAVYCGELLTLADADTRPGDQYMFALDVKLDLVEQCAEKSQVCVDAQRYGSAARFINHSCRPNLAPVRVFTAHRDLRMPAVVLFATQHIRANRELTFDYGDKFWSVKSKWMKCECDAPDCRYPSKADEES